MSSINKSIEIFSLSEQDYKRFRNEMITLYIHSFTTGEFAQLIDESSAEKSLDGYVSNGKVMVAIDADRVVGLIAGVPLKYDLDFPDYSSSIISIDNSFYISEVMVHGNFRGGGVATKLIDTFLDYVKLKCSFVVIRVWDRNLPAFNLYKKLGFEYLTSINQNKLSIDGECLEMNKVYMYKRLSGNNKRFKQ